MEIAKPTAIATAAVTGRLTSTGFCIPTTTLRKGLGAKYEAFLNKLTIVYQGKVGLPKRTMLYTHIGTLTYIPRSFIVPLLRCGVIAQLAITLTPVPSVEIPCIDLYPDQMLIVDHLVATVFTPRRIAAGTATCVFNLRAGQGKTFVAAGVISAVGKRTLYISPTCYLAEQAAKDLCSMLGAGVAVEYTAGASARKRAVIDAANVNVITIDSALRMSAEQYARFGLVVMDEVHMYCSDQRMKIFQRCSWAVLGLTATSEGLTKGRDPILKHYLAADNIIRAENIPGFAYTIDAAYTCRAHIIKYAGPPEYTKFLTHDSTGMLFTHYMHEQFLADETRLRLAICKLVEAFDWRGPAGQRHRIYVFAEEIKLLREAKGAFERVLTMCGRADIVRAIGIDDPDTLDPVNPTAAGNGDAYAATALAPSGIAGMFTGGTKIGEVTDIWVLFATYGFAGQGVSIVDMTAIFLLTPRRSNFIQIFARILRRGSDKDIPRVIYDLVDIRTALSGQLRARLPAYEYYGFELIHTKIKYEDVPAEVHRVLAPRFIDAYWQQYATLKIVHADIVCVVFRFIIRSYTG